MSSNEKMKNKGALNRFAGLIECLDKKILNTEEIETIKRLKEDDVVVCGRMLSCYAFAILDILGIEKYSGNNIDIKRLINELNYGKSQIDP